VNPLVTFVVPCFKLAHLLPECIQSILAQTYKQFEVLIMDDCSPDDTPAVAQSFSDPRVRHIRNDPNLGHLRNYNKGIEMAVGKYVWLISADDCLRSISVLSRYVQMMEHSPRIGYVFCPAMGLVNGQESGVRDYSVHGHRDHIFNGRQFLCKLIRANTIVAASGLVRRDCYDKLGTFPLDMPWAGDWYLWCLFALYYDVGYQSEPMVYYREHDLSMTRQLMIQSVRSCVVEDMSMPWMIKGKADTLGFRKVSKACLYAAAEEYARSIASQRYKGATTSFTLTEFDDVVDSQRITSKEKARLRARVYTSIADRYYWRNEPKLATWFYDKALAHSFWSPQLHAKHLSLALGPLGQRLRCAWPAARRFVLSYHRA
jgi:glycosyltransferase involved in cell wall biosynthesis